MHVWILYSATLLWPTCPLYSGFLTKAILFQKKNNYPGWESYDAGYIKKDIESRLLYKIVCRNTIACIFSICYSDPLIWRNKEKKDAVYLHRIVLNRIYKNEQMFRRVLAWAVQHAMEKKLKFIRMDTWADNAKIIEYYTTYGFRFVENYTTPGTQDLPLQHRNLKVALLEFDVPREQGLQNPALSDS